jgi:hypothetical protein
MKKLIDYIDNEKLSKFTENAKSILTKKMEAAVDNERFEVAANFFGPITESDDYEEAEPNMDVDIDPEDWDEDEIAELEAIVWDEDDDGDIDEDDVSDLTYEQVVYAVERAEQLDEISKKLLGSYVDAAADDLKFTARQGGREHARGENTKKSYDAANKRLKGIRMATKKLTKEQVEHLVELSRKTLASYTRKAADDMASKHGENLSNRKDHEARQNKLNNAEHNADWETKQHLRKAAQADRDVGHEKENKLRRGIFKRSIGIKRATDRLAKD